MEDVVTHALHLRLHLRFASLILILTLALGPTQPPVKLLLGHGLANPLLANAIAGNLWILASTTLLGLQGL